MSSPIPTPAAPIPETLLARATELIAAAGTAGLPMRLLGGLAVFAVAESARRPPLARPYRDFDLAVPAKQGPAASRVLQAADFLPDKHFNALHGARRLIFRAPEGYPVDVLIGEFEMCHRLDIESGFGQHDVTVSPADLLLTKLQIVRIEEKDLADASALVLDLPPGPAGIDVRRFVQPLKDDWGFFHSVDLNLDKLLAFARATLHPAEVAIATERVTALAGAMADAPKSLRWKMRARVGERLAWYELPDEPE